MKGRSAGNGVGWKSEISPDTVHSAVTFTDLGFIKHLLYSESTRRAEKLAVLKAESEANTRHSVGGDSKSK